MRTIAALFAMIATLCLLVGAAPAPRAHEHDAPSAPSIDLAGHYRSDAQGDAPAMVLHIVPIEVSGLDATMYMELARADDPAAPFRQAVLQLYTSKDRPMLRVWDFPDKAVLPAITSPRGAVPSIEIDLAGVCAGLWAAPDVMPAIDGAQLEPNLDLAITQNADGWTARTEHRFPTSMGGAFSMSSFLRKGRDGTLASADRGFDTDGKLVWGPAGDGADNAVLFRPYEPRAGVKRFESGLVVVELVPVPDDAVAHVEGGELAVDYTGWTTSGVRFDSSRQEGRTPFRTRIPGQLIAGWNEGMLGITEGGRRKLVIPGDLAYGPTGRPEARIPPDATLIFDVGCVDVSNPVARPAPAP